jgi:8-oxo-dGTP diphosphatase
MTMDHPRHILVVSCLVRNAQGDILLVRHRKRGWELPQGRVEEGEGLLAALHREVLEETGVTIMAPVAAAVWSKLTAPAALIHGFVAEYAGTPIPSAETPEVAWLPEAEARNRIEHPVNRDRLANLLSFDDRIRFYRYTTEPYRRLPDTSTS